jgi:uncharacterized protein (AIM24 family)
VCSVSPSGLGFMASAPAQYCVFGMDLQVLHFILKPGESVTGDRGSFCYSSGGVEVESRPVWGQSILDIVSRLLTG